MLSIPHLNPCTLICTLTLSICLAQDSVAENSVLADQEIELLNHAASLPEDLRVRPAQAPPAELMEKLRSAAAALSMGSAQQMRASVFRPSHNLPTVTLAEQVSSIYDRLDGILYACTMDCWGHTWHLFSTGDKLMR